MKTKMLMPVALIAGLLVTTSAIVAHHGAAAFDMSNPVVLKDAVITQLVWINPHPLIKAEYADYNDEKGDIEHWTMEMGSIPSSQLIGWTRTTLKAGDSVTLYVDQAKKRANGGRLNKVVLGKGAINR